MSHRLRYRWLVALTLIAASMGSAITAAQLLNGGNGTPPNETIQIQTGNILEILPIHSFPSATYSWILTQDRNFLEVGRNAFYSTRLINPGHFTLNAEVSTPTGQTVLRRIFTIDVRPRQSLPSENVDTPTNPGNPAPASLVRTEPAERDDGLIILPPNQALLLLTPLHDDLRPLQIDLDAQNDTNDDDSLTNDIDNAGTFFQTSGTPLYLWFTSSLEQRDITVHARGTDSTPLTQALSVLPADYAKQRGLFVSRVQISTEERGPRTLLFSPKFESGGTPTLPLLFHWDFGDDTESIEEHPLHAYQTYGTYTVHLSVRNIETGKELAARTVIIPLKAPLIQDPNTRLSSPALPEEPTSPPHTSFLRTALTILGVAAGFTAIGFIAAWVSHTVKKRLRKRKTAPKPPPTKPQPSPPPDSPQLSSPPKPPTSALSTPNWLKKGPPSQETPSLAPASPLPPKAPQPPLAPPPVAKSPPLPPANAPTVPIVPTILASPVFDSEIAQTRGADPTPPEPTSPKPPAPTAPPPPPVPLPKPNPPAPPKPAPATPTIQPPVSKNPITAPVPVLKKPAASPGTLPTLPKVTPPPSPPPPAPIQARAPNPNPPPEAKAPVAPPLPPIPSTEKPKESATPPPTKEQKPSAPSTDRTIAIVQAENIQPPKVSPPPL